MMLYEFHGEYLLSCYTVVKADTEAEARAIAEKRLLRIAPGDSRAEWVGAGNETVRPHLSELSPLVRKEPPHAD